MCLIHDLATHFFSWGFGCTNARGTCVDDIFSGSNLVDMERNKQRCLESKSNSYIKAKIISWALIRKDLKGFMPETS